MTGIEKVVSWVQGLISAAKIPTGKVPPVLLYCTAIKRSGGSPIKTSAEMIDMMGRLGFPIGKNEDGSDNMMNVFAYIIAKANYNMVHNDMVIHGSMAPGVKSVGYTSDGAAVNSVTVEFADTVGVAT